jgi:hypothetical protein
MKNSQDYQQKVSFLSMNSDKHKQALAIDNSIEKHKNDKSKCKFDRMNFIDIAMPANRKHFNLSDLYKSSSDVKQNKDVSEKVSLMVKNHL